MEALEGGYINFGARCMGHPDFAYLPWWEGGGRVHRFCKILILKKN